MERRSCGAVPPATEATPTRALAKISGFAKSASPFVRAVMGYADAAVEDWLESRLGEEFRTRLARVPMSLGHAGVDPFGLDPQWAKYAILVATFLHRHYFRSDVFGIENVPKGRVLLVANHSGQVPLDGVLIGAALFADAEPPRIMRAMVEKWSQTLPFVGTAFSRIGQVVGVPENARRLLE